LGAIFANGVLHILGGLDHLLFLVALVLPAVVERRDRRWIARLDLRAALLQVAWIATAFTAAHSITLGLASFGLVRLPASVIEPLIAVTVLAAALNNLWPLVTARLALVAFGFGLIHGFGFAEVLAPLELPAFELARALLRFNLGVEVGQLVIVAVSFALLVIVRRWRGYPRWILGAGSAALAVIACAWIVERIFDLSILPV
jgi:hydrogenase/urease accessory protein HupE